MREEFTAHLKLALDKAQGEARVLNQDFVSTEHLLLALLDTDGSEAVAGLRLGGVERGELRKKLLAAIPRGADAPVVTGTLPLSPKAVRAVNGALVKAQSAGAPRVSSRLLLCSLLEECETAVRSAMRGAGADLDHLQRVLVQDGAIPPED
jgi:ATP-dependent Clp protease ATP-binding subunit ClpC